MKPEATSKAADIDNDQQQQHAMAPSLKRGGPASDRKDDEVAIKTHVLQSHDAIANKAAERQRSASNAPMTAAELRLRLDILQERRKHFRNEASGYEHDIAEIDMLEETPAQNEAIENLKAASRPAFETTGIMVRWNGELDNQMKALVAGQTDQRDSSTRMGWSYAQEHLVSKPSFDPEQASRSKGKARVHTTDDSDEELSSLEDDQK